MLKTLIKKFFTPFWILLAMTGMGVGSFTMGAILEHVGKFPACIFCHIERFIFLGGGTMAFLALVWRQHNLGRFLCGGLLWVWLSNSVLGFYHAGIQYGLFKTPSFCKVKEAKGDTIDDQLANFLSEPSASCDQRTLDIFSIPMSLYVGILCLALAIVTVWCYRKMRDEKIFI